MMFKAPLNNLNENDEVTVLKSIKNVLLKERYEPNDATL